MKVMLQPGDKLSVEFADTDGEFEIHYDTKEHDKSIVVKETGGLPGSITGDANAVLYEEHFGDQDPGDVMEHLTGTDDDDDDDDDDEPLDDPVNWVCNDCDNTWTVGSKITPTECPDCEGDDIEKQ